jgi:hypothetical protein
VTFMTWAGGHTIASHFLPGLLPTSPPWQPSALQLACGRTFSLVGGDGAPCVAAPGGNRLGSLSVTSVSPSSYGLFVTGPLLGADPLEGQVRAGGREGHGACGRAEFLQGARS